MKHKVSITIIAIFVIVAVATAALYITKKDVKIFQRKTSQSYEKSAIVSLPMLKVKTLNPLNSVDKDTYYISKLIFESLFSLDENLTAQPELVSACNFDRVSKELSITIRRDAYFSNGEPLTAADVKFSIDSLKAAPKTLYAKYVSSIRAVSVDKNDDYSLIIKYSDLNNSALENLIFPIVSQKQFAEVAKSSKQWENGAVPIGSGAYKIASYNDITEMELEANEYYQGEKPTNKLRFTVLFSEEDTIPMLDVSTISLGISESMSIDTLIADKNIKLKTFCSPDAEVVGFNFKSKFMENKNFRKAVAHCVDVDEINTDIYYGNGIESDSIYFPNYLGVKNEGDRYKYSKQKAKRFLSKTPFTDLNKDGILDVSDKEAVNIKILVNKKHSEKVLTAEKIAEGLAGVGVNTTLIFAENDADFAQKIATGNFDLFVATFHFNETYDLRNLLHSGYGNAIGYKNTKLDELLDKLKSGLSKEDETQAYGKIKKLIGDELPYYCILYKTYGAMLSENIKGVNSVYFNNFYKDAPNWYCEYEVH